MLERLGRYDVLDRIGQGAMGAVYRGRDSVLEREVALKVISCATESDELTTRFRREAQAIARLSHPNIVAIYEFGETAAGEPFIAMELLRGETLQEAATQRKLSLQSKLTITAQVCGALSHAHSRGIIHRDIKPANILLSETGSAKVTDFGIARLATGTLTQSGALFGTPQFMSPEQITGRGIDHRSDIFAVGTLLYWLIAGKYPFAGESIPEVLHKILTERPRPLSPTGAAFGALQSILDRALMKNPADRYPDASEMARDLAGVRRLLEPAGEDWPAAVASSTPLHVTGLPRAEPTELLPGRRLPAPALVRPVETPPTGSRLPAPSDLRIVDRPASVSRGAGIVAPPSGGEVHPAEAPPAAGVWTRRAIQLQVLAAGSVVVLAALWFFGATAARRGPDPSKATPSAPASTLAIPTSSPPPPSPPRVPSPPPPPAPGTVRLIVECPAELQGSIRSMLSSRFKELGIQQVAEEAPARVQLEVNVRASSVEELMFDTKIVRNQASVTLHAIDLSRHQVLGDRDSGIVTNNVQDVALGKTDAVNRALARVLTGDEDILKQVAGHGSRQEKP